MAHMDAPRGIGEHLEDVGFRLYAVVGGVEGASLLPDFLPVRIGLERIEARCHRFDLPYDLGIQPFTAFRRSSRALVSMISLSFCTEIGSASCRERVCQYV